MAARIRRSAGSRRDGRPRVTAAATAAAAALMAIAAAGCGSGDGAPNAAAHTSAETSTNPAPVTTPYNPKIDSADFGGPIDNPYLPLRPGALFRYRGVGDDGKTPELNTVKVTHRHKRIMGIDAVVVLDQVFADGTPEERTFDWYAQDHHGNVWYLGEDSRNWEHGRWVKDDGSWEAGVGNGKPGIIMLAHPKRGDAYRQEYAPGHALDQARVLGPWGRVAVPYRTFGRTLATREFSTIDRQAERKIYARGVGVIKERALTKSGELSVLVAVRR